MTVPRIFADFHNSDTFGRVRLNCVGTLKDLSCQQIVLQDGVRLTLYSEDLEADGTVQYSDDESIWVAVIDWDAVRRSETPVPELEETPLATHVPPSSESRNAST